MYVEYPHIHGTAEEKIEQISNYLFKLAEVSNYNLDQSTPEGIFRQAAEAVTSAESEAIEKGQRAKFGSLRDLIIKSAGSVMISQEEISHSLAGLFVATSDFGTFKKETEQNFSANSESFKSLFKKSEEISTDLTNYKTEMQNYIFAGYDGDTFALDVGLLKDTYTEDGKTTENGTPKKIRITPSRLSLFSGDYEAAYLSENAIYFPNANITGGTLNIGSGRFTVDSEGALSATGAKISGNITATSGSFFSGELKAATGSFSGNITATGGTIAGWKIGTGAPGLPATATAIYNEMTGEDGTKYSIGMQSNFYSTDYINFYVRSQKKGSSGWEDIFYVKNNGKLKAINAEIEGTISASSISASSITNGTYGAGSIGFSLTDDGALSASGATIYGTIKASSFELLGNATLSRGDTPANNKTGFKVDSSGKLTASSAKIWGDITANSGYIAGWNIGTGSKYMESSDMLYYTDDKGDSEVGFNPKSNNEVFYIRKFSRNGDYDVISFSKDGGIYTQSDITCRSLYSYFGKIKCTAAPPSSPPPMDPRDEDVITVNDDDLARVFWVSPLGHVGAKKFYTIDDTGNATGNDLQTQINGKASTGHTHGNTLLWSGYNFLTSEGKNIATITFSDKISNQNIGVVLVFAPCTLNSQGGFDSITQYFYQSFFIPKDFIPSNDCKIMSFGLHYENFNLNGNKILKIYNNKIEGYPTNNNSGTSNGITYNNKRFVLIKVYGV